MKAPDLTPRQIDTFVFIRRFAKKNKRSPTYREIGAALDTSIGAVKNYVHALENGGWIKRIGGRKFRQLEIVRFK